MHTLEYLVVRGLPVVVGVLMLALAVLDFCNGRHVGTAVFSGLGLWFIYKACKE